MHKAELYTSSHGLQKNDAAQILSEYIAYMRWKPGDRVLDLGCGPGFVTTQELLPRLPSDFGLLMGADLSSAMVQHATNSYIHPKLKFSELDLNSDVTAYSEPWAPGFDKIFSFYCLHWIPDQRRAVRNVYNLLRPGGEALIIFLAKCPIFNVYNIQRGKPEWQKYMKDADRFISPYQQSADPGEEFNRILVDAGFQVIDCACRERKYSYSSANCLKDSIRAVNPFLDRIPTELHEEYLNDCMLEATKLKIIESNNNVEKITAVRYELIVAYIRKT